MTEKQQGPTPGVHLREVSIKTELTVKTLSSVPSGSARHTIIDNHDLPES